MDVADTWDKWACVLHNICIDQYDAGLCTNLTGLNMSKPLNKINWI